MHFAARGIKAGIILLFLIVFTIIILAFLFQLFLILLPLMIIFAIIGYFFRILNRMKKEDKDYLDVTFKVKK